MGHSDSIIRPTGYNVLHSVIYRDDDNFFEPELNLVDISKDKIEIYNEVIISEKLIVNKVDILEEILNLKKQNEELKMEIEKLRKPVSSIPIGNNIPDRKEERLVAKFEFGDTYVSLKKDVNGEEFLKALIEYIEAGVADMYGAITNKLMSMVSDISKSDLEFVLNELTFPESEYPYIFKINQKDNTMELTITSVEDDYNRITPYTICTIHSYIRGSSRTQNDIAFV